MSSYKIVCGEHNLQLGSSGEPNEIELDVVEIVNHPRYIRAPLGYDIAVYKVNIGPLIGRSEILPENNQIYPACLPRINEGYKEGDFVVAGWGLTQSRIIKGTRVEVRGIQNIPRHVEVPFHLCEDPDKYTYPDGLVCAGKSGKDSCQGDSGGPLMKAQQRTDGIRYEWIGDEIYLPLFFQFCNSIELQFKGIVSYGVGCGEENYPGAYTRTSCYLDWIAQQYGMTAESSTQADGETGYWSTKCQKYSSRYSTGSDSTIEARVVDSGPQLIHYYVHNILLSPYYHIYLQYPYHNVFK